MQSDRPDAGNEEFSVRLAWPKPSPAESAEDASEATAPDAKAAGPAPDVPPPPGARSAPATPPVGAPVPGKPPAGAAKGPTVTAKPRPASTEVARQPRPTSTALEVANPAPDTTRMGRVFVEAFDRLADRLLERLRSLRQDVDADLTAVRSELSGLRQSVDDIGDRVQLRQLRTTLDELRADVTGLRRAVLEWPELEQITTDIAAVRSDLAFLYETGVGGGEGMQAPSELLAELQAVVAHLGERSLDPALDQPQLAVLAPLVEEVASVRSELTSIRRRIVLRSSPLDAEQLEQIVSAVAARVVEELGDGRRSRRR